MDYNLLKTFAKVSELGSFTQAAKNLNQPKSRVSRAITRLEQELDVQLIRRTTRKTTLTNSGQELYQNIAPLLAGIEKELISVSNHQQEMSGVIRVTASQDIAQTLVTKIISAYNKKFPKVVFETLITNDYLDLTKENIDVAFRAGKMADSTLIQKKFLSANFIIACSKKYIELNGLPSTIEELQDHKFLSFKSMERDLLKKEIKLDPILTSDSIPMLLNLALNSYGIVILPDFFCQEHIDSKSLVQILPKWKTKAANIHILYPPSKIISKKVQAFIKIAGEAFTS